MEKINVFKFTVWRSVLHVKIKIKHELRLLFNQWNPLFISAASFPRGKGEMMTTMNSLKNRIMSCTCHLERTGITRRWLAPGGQSCSAIKWVSQSICMGVSTDGKGKYRQSQVAKRNIFMKILKIHKRGKIKNKLGTDQRYENKPKKSKLDLLPIMLYLSPTFIPF